MRLTRPQYLDDEQSAKANYLWLISDDTLAKQVQSRLATHLFREVAAAEQRILTEANPRILIGLKPGEDFENLIENQVSFAARMFALGYHECSIDKQLERLLEA